MNNRHKNKSSNHSNPITRGRTPGDRNAPANTTSLHGGEIRTSTRPRRRHRRGELHRAPPFSLGENDTQLLSLTDRARLEWRYSLSACPSSPINPPALGRVPSYCSIAAGCARSAFPIRAECPSESTERIFYLIKNK